MGPIKQLPVPNSKSSKPAVKGLVERPVKFRDPFLGFGRAAAHLAHATHTRQMLGLLMFLSRQRRYAAGYVFALLQSVAVLDPNVSILSNRQVYSITLKDPKARLLFQKIVSYIKYFTCRHFSLYVTHIDDAEVSGSMHRGISVFFTTQDKHSLIVLSVTSPFNFNLLSLLSF